MAVNELSSGEGIKFTGVQARRMSIESGIKFISSRLPDMIADGSDILVLPEKWIVDPVESESDGLNDLLKSLCELSGANACLVIPGSFSVKRNGGLYNSSPIIDHGDILGWQDKISPFGNERTVYSTGSEVRIFDTSVGKISVPVCYDIDFPYFLKVSVRMGAELAINPSLIDSQFHDEWHLYISARSLENRIPVLSVNSLSSPFNGNSVAIQPYLHSYGFRIRKVEAGNSEAFSAGLDGKGIKDYMKKRMEEDPGNYSLRE